MQGFHQEGKKGKIFYGAEREKKLIEENGSKKGKIVLEKRKTGGEAPGKDPF